MAPFNQHVFHILLKPDVWLRGELDRVLAELLKHHIEVCHYDIVRPSRTLLEIMYTKGFQWKFDFFSHHMRFYELGPSISLLCRLNTKTDFNRCIKAIKGSSLPNKPLAGSIRDQMGVADRCVNMIHIADSLTLSQQELCFVFQASAEQLSAVSEESLSKTQLVSGINYLIGMDRHYRASEFVAAISVRVQHRCNFSNLTAPKKSPQDRHIGQEYLTVLAEQMAEYHSVFDSQSSEMRIRYLDYLFFLMNRCMIYFSAFEKYVLTSDAYYREVNLTELPCEVP